jgi:MoxR-like ATPase
MPNSNSSINLDYVAEKAKEVKEIATKNDIKEVDKIELLTLKLYAEKGISLGKIEGIEKETTTKIIIEIKEDSNFDLDQSNFQDVVDSVVVKFNLEKYINLIADKIKKSKRVKLYNHKWVSETITSVSKSMAAIRGRDSVTAEDIESIIYYAMRNRLALISKPEVKESSIKEILKEIVDSINVPKR